MADPVPNPIVAHDASPIDFVAVFAPVAPAMFLGSLDQTIVATALPAIAAKLNAFSGVAWIVTAYLLASTIAAPIYGRLGDAIGRKRALLGALALFVVGSAACALAPNFTLLVMARGLQGLGGGGLMTLSQAMIGEKVSPKDRGRFQGWFGAIFALASTAGPILGGLLSDTIGWRWIFWINVPLGLGAAIAAWRAASAEKTGHFVLDIAGTSIFIAATLAMLIALNIGPGNGWTSPTVLVLAALAALGFALLMPVERRVAVPLLSPGLLRQPVVWRSAICVVLFAAALFAAIVQLPLLLELGYGVAATVAGLLLIPLTLAQVVVSTWAGRRVSATGRPRGPLIVGLGVATAGFAALATFLDAGLPAIAATSLLFGLGLGTTMPVAQTLAQWAGGATRLGAATATLTFARAVGGVVGTAITAAILIAAMEHYAPGSSAKIQSLLDGGSASSLPTDAVHLAFRWVFGAIAVMTLLGALLATTLPDVNLADPEPEA